MTIGRVLLAITMVIMPSQPKTEQNYFNISSGFSAVTETINGTNVTDFEVFDLDTESSDPFGSLYYNFSEGGFEATTIEYLERVTKKRDAKIETKLDTNWPVKHSAEMPGDLILGGLMMVHEREDSITCGPVMPQGGVQALETMLYTLDVINRVGLLPNLTIGAHILDDCDKDTYGLEMAVDFIKGE